MSLFASGARSLNPLARSHPRFPRRTPLLLGHPTPWAPPAHRPGCASCGTRSYIPASLLSHPASFPLSLSSPADLASTVRAGFEAARASPATAAGDATTARHVLADGRLQLKRLEEMLGMQR